MQILMREQLYLYLSDQAYYSYRLYFSLIFLLVWDIVSERGVLMLRNVSVSFSPYNPVSCSFSQCATVLLGTRSCSCDIHVYSAPFPASFHLLGCFLLFGQLPNLLPWLPLGPCLSTLLFSSLFQFLRSFCSKYLPYSKLNVRFFLIN